MLCDGVWRTVTTTMRAAYVGKGFRSRHVLNPKAPRKHGNVQRGATEALPQAVSHTTTPRRTASTSCVIRRNHDAHALAEGDGSSPLLCTCACASVSRKEARGLVKQCPPSFGAVHKENDGNDAWKKNTYIFTNICKHLITFIYTKTFIGLRRSTTVVWKRWVRRQ